MDTLQFPPLSDIHKENAVLFYRMISQTNYRRSEYESWCEISGNIPAGSNKKEHYHRANLFQFTKSLGFSFDISEIRINNRSYVKLASKNPKADGGRKPGQRRGIVECEDDEMLQCDDILNNKKGEVHFD